MKECSACHAFRILHEYSDSLGAINVLDQTFPPAGILSQEHFLAYTFHSVPNISHEQALVIKDFLTSFLGVPRHLFCLKKAEEGSVILTWQLPCMEFKNFKLKLEEMNNELKAEFFAKANISRIKLRSHLEAEVEVFIRKRKRSDDISSTTDEELTSLSSITVKRKAHGELSMKCEGNVVIFFPSTITYQVHSCDT